MRGTESEPAVSPRQRALLVAVRRALLMLVTAIDEYLGTPASRRRDER